MSDRRFPVLNQQNCRQLDKKWMPRSVAWEFAETFRVQANANHSQSLETLASRGGLAPEEMWLAAHGHGLFKVKIDEQEAIDWLISHPAADAQPTRAASPPGRATSAPAHDRNGNCWDETKVYACRPCGKGNLCDVCHRHDVPRGDCYECPCCPLCAELPTTTEHPPKDPR